MIFFPKKTRGSWKINLQMNDSSLKLIIYIRTNIMNKEVKYHYTLPIKNMNVMTKNLKKKNAGRSAQRAICRRLTDWSVIFSRL